jgi:unsaturated chondroitin disaccharide hydrolase
MPHPRLLIPAARPTLRASRVVAFVALALLVGLGGSLAGAAGTATARPARAWIEGFGGSLPGWRFAGALQAARVRSRGERLLQLGAGRGGGELSHRLPSARWTLSVDLALAPKTAVEVGFSQATRPALRLARGKGGARASVVGGGAMVGDAPPGARRLRGSLHLQATRDRRTIVGSLNGHGFSLRYRRSPRLEFRLRRGRLQLDNLIETSATNRPLLLLHRLADLEARVPRHLFLVGADTGDRLYLRRRYWTRGFLAGALWRAADLVGASDPFGRWALDRTVANFGYEHADTHDQGFIYENSSALAYQRLCGGAQRRSRLCRRLRASGLAAAQELVALSATNYGAGTIPTRSDAPSFTVADTIIDSMGNLPLLYWASDVTGDPVYRSVAARHAEQIASLLVRPDGSTAQAVYQDRLTGEVLGVHTHQGVSASSTWARGEGWAIYGFARAAGALRDPKLLSVAERIAAWLEEHVPASGVPPYDYDAPAGAPSDVSAAAISAAGLLRLSLLCRDWDVACENAGRWQRLGERMLAGSLSQVSRVPPIGFLGGQVGTYGGESWDDQAEMIYGLHYAMEAAVLDRSARSR